MTRASRKHAIDWDLFWMTHPGTLEDPPEISISEAHEAARFLAGYARNAAELRDWLKMCGLFPYEHGPRSGKTPAGCATTTVSYRRPGA